MVTLRAATADDAAAVGAIWDAGFRDGLLGNVPDELVATRTPESFTTRAAARIAGDSDEPPVEIVVAVVDGAVAGFVMVADDEVEQVCVAAEHRGSGVAAALLAEAEALVRANGHEQAWLAVVAGNARARRFYERSGWTDEGPFIRHVPGPDGPIEVPAHRYVISVVEQRRRPGA